MVHHYHHHHATLALKSYYWFRILLQSIIVLNSHFQCASWVIKHTSIVPIHHNNIPNYRSLPIFRRKETATTSTSSALQQQLNNNYNTVMDSSSNKEEVSNEQVSTTASNNSPTNNRQHKKQRKNGGGSNSNNKNYSNCKWVTCSSSKELSNAISKLLHPTDVVAELGSQLREVSEQICESLARQDNDDNIDHDCDNTGGGKAVLVDVCRHYPPTTKKQQPTHEEKTRTRAMRRQGDEHHFYPNVATFLEIPQLDDWRSAFFTISNIANHRKTGIVRTKGGGGKDGDDDDEEETEFEPPTVPQYDVFILDVNVIVGNDLEFTSLSIVKEFLALNGGPKSCRLVLIKSDSLNKWACNSITGEQWVLDGGSHNQPEHQVRSTMSNIIATVGVQEYRNTIPVTVLPGDAVLEVGCHFGTSTALLHTAASAMPSTSTATTEETEKEATTTTTTASTTLTTDSNKGGNNGSRDKSSNNSNNSNGNNSNNMIENGNSTGHTNGYCIGVDVGKKIIQNAKQRYPHIYFSVGDAWRTASLLRIQQNYLFQQQFNYPQINQQQLAAAATTTIPQQNQPRIEIGFQVVYVDVGGLSGHDGLLESLCLLSSIIHALEPRSIVIKSQCMRQLASVLVPYWKYQKKLDK